MSCSRGRGIEWKRMVARACALVGEKCVVCILVVFGMLRLTALEWVDGVYPTSPPSVWRKQAWKHEFGWYESCYRTNAVTMLCTVSNDRRCVQKSSGIGRLGMCGSLLQHF